MGRCETMRTFTLPIGNSRCRRWSARSRQCRTNWRQLCLNPCCDLGDGRLAPAALLPAKRNSCGTRLCNTVSYCMLPRLRARNIPWYDNLHEEAKLRLETGTKLKLGLIWCLAIIPSLSRKKERRQGLVFRSMRKHREREGRKRNREKKTRNV